MIIIVMIVKIMTVMIMMFMMMTMMMCCARIIKYQYSSSPFLPICEKVTQ